MTKRPYSMLLRIKREDDEAAMRQMVADIRHHLADSTGLDIMDITDNAALLWAIRWAHQNLPARDRQQQPVKDGGEETQP